MRFGTPGALLLALCGHTAPGMPPLVFAVQQPEAKVGSPKSVKHLPPNHVRVKATPNGMEISWDPPQTMRIGSFTVYRLHGDKWVKIAPEVRTSKFTDPDNDDPSVRYSVAAVDVSGVEGQRSKPVDGR